MKNIYSTLVFVCLLFISKAQTPSYVWAEQTRGNSGNTRVQSLDVDASGNVVITGLMSGTVDFDPSGSTLNLSTTGGIQDCFLAKYDVNGNLLWAKNWGGTLGSQVVNGHGVAFDVNGNVFVTGIFSGSVDFDPSASVVTNSTPSGYNVFVCKYSPAGTFLWAKVVSNLSGQSYAEGGIKTDSSGNFVIGGQYSGTADFDMGTGTYTITAQGGYDAYFSKYDNNGNFIFAKSMGGAASDGINDFNLDNNGNIFTTGFYNQSGAASTNSDFDPGAGVANLFSPAAYSQIFLARYDANGNYILAKGITGTGNSYGNGIIQDPSGNIYVSGYFGGTSDFDPGAGSYTLSAMGTNTVSTYFAKYDVAGNFGWANSLNAPASCLSRANMGYDYNGNIVFAGEFGGGTMDADASASTYTLPYGAGTAAYVCIYDTAGVFKSAFSIGASTANVNNLFKLKVIGTSIYIGGQFNGTQDFDPSVVTNTLVAGGGTDGYFANYSNPCTTAPIQPTAIQGFTVLCSNSAATYSVSNVLGATSYTWSLPLGWSGSSTTNSISVVAGSTGILSVTASNACGSSAQQTLNVSVNPSPTINVNSGSICSGQSFTIAPSGASTYTIQGGNAIVSPTSNASYTVVGTSTAGCVSAGPATSNVTVVATPTANAGSSQTITCTNPTVSLNGSGVTTFTWSGAGIVSGGNSANPVVNAPGTFSLTGSFSGCTSNTSTVSVISDTAAPSVSASTSSSIICGPPFQGTVTLTATGANSYTWNPGGTGTMISVSPSVTTQYTVTGTNSTNGCTNSVVITQSVSPCTGIDQFSIINSELQVYPNPFVSSFIISLNNISKSTKLEIINCLGSLIFKDSISEEKTEIDLSQFPSGIYFIKVGTVAKKLVKQ
ncbi:MAG: T9SS type A sorting domain-containing protein [Bacteroidia bacterium]